MLYLIEGGDPILIDHLPLDTIVALLRTGARIEDRDQEDIDQSGVCPHSKQPEGPHQIQAIGLA